MLIQIAVVYKMKVFPRWYYAFVLIKSFDVILL